MEAIPAIIGAIEVAVLLKHGIGAAKEASGAAKDSIKALESNINSIEKALELVPDVQLTPREKELLGEWKVECEDILQELRNQADRAFEMCSSVGLRNTIVARCRQLCYDSKKDDRLRVRLMRSELQLNNVLAWLTLER